MTSRFLTDGVWDGVEVPHSPGSCPCDASDEGSPTNCVTLILTVGDPSGSESERWNLEVFEEGTGRAVVCHCDDGFGTPGSAEYSLVKGKAYTFSLRWVATNLDEGPDYDWRAKINYSTAAGAYEGLYGTGPFIVEDPDELLTDETHGNAANITLGKTGRIIVPKVEFEEDPNQNYGFDPDGPWISVEKAKTTTVKVNISPPSAVSQVYFTSSDTSKVTVSPSQASGSTQTLTLTAGSIEDDGATIDVRLGSASGPVCERLGVAVYEKVTISFYIHAVNGFTGSIPVGAANNVLKQAVVELSNAGYHGCTHDISAGYQYDVDIDEPHKEHYVLINGCHAYGTQDLFMIPSPGKIRSSGQIWYGLHWKDTNPDVHWNIIAEDASPRYRYMAHEFFHTWAGHISETGNLMHPNETSMGDKLKKAQWDIAHQ